MKKIGLYIGIVFLFFSCKKEIGPQNVEEENGEGNLIVLNEGNFGVGNASVSIYNPNTEEIFNNQFRAVNGFGIGDVLQSVTRYQNQFYFVVNNSGKIVITDTNLIFQSEITGFNSPRYVEFANGKGFVTDLKQKVVYVFDLFSNQITHQIQTKGWTEQILLHQNKLYVMDRGDYLSNSAANTIFIINPVTLLIEDSMATYVNPNSMAIDRNQKLWVLSSGKSGVEVPHLAQYDLNTKALVQSFGFASSTLPSRLTISLNKSELYYINSSVYKMNYLDASLPTIPFYQKTTENFYGISMITQSNDVFLFDAKDYNQQGTMIRLDSSAIEKETLSCGIIPSLLR